MSLLKSPLWNSSSPRDNEPEKEKVEQWLEERTQRRLQGEYQSAVSHLSELINANMSTPLSIASVRVEGAVSTRSSFLGSIIHPLVPPHGPENTVESSLHAVRKIGDVLQTTDIFKSVTANLQTSRSSLAQPGDVDVIFKTAEKGRLFLSTSTELGNGEGSASATGRLRNVFGGAEMLEANVSFGTKTRRSYHATLNAPLTADLKTKGEITAFGLERDHSSFASATEGMRGIRSAIRRGTLGHGIHELGYEGVIRQIANLTPTASLSMREAAGQSTKSALSYTWTRDTRNDKLLATSGIYTKLRQEIAGLGGDAEFYKAEGEAHISRGLPYLPGVIASLSARAGFMQGLRKPSLFSDRFQLGGPTSVRSFRTNGLGPRDGSDSLGGDLYWSAGASIISNVPYKAHWPLKTHVYVNAGRLDAIDKSRTVQENLTESFTKPSISAGVGLILLYDPVRVEVNFGVPLVTTKGDAARKGFQVGMGLEFL